MAPGARFQVGVDVIIDDRSLNRYVASARRAIAAISQNPARAGRNQIAQVTQELAQAEAAIRRSVTAGSLSRPAARTARTQLGDVGAQFGIDPAAVRAQAKEINQELAKQRQAERRKTAAAEAAATAKTAAAAEEKAQAAAARVAATAATKSEKDAARASDRKARSAEQEARAAARAAVAEEQRLARERRQGTLRRGTDIAARFGSASPERAAQRLANVENARIAAIQAETPVQIARRRELALLSRRRREADERHINAIERAARAQEDARAPRFQRFQQAVSLRAGGEYRPATSFPGAGQLLAARALTVASFAAPGALLFGAIRQIREVSQEVLLLERVTARLRSQFEATGESAAFPGFRRDLLGIARDTGVAGDKVAFVGLQMKGAFGRDTQVAVERTAEAIRAAQVSGLDLVEIVDSLTAASISYGVSIDAITDKAIGLEQRFGVVNQQSIKALGDIAPVAKQSGLELAEVAAILGIIQQRSALAGSAITEGLGRILPAIGEQADKILALAASTPALADDAERFADQFREGKTGQVLLGIADNWDQLSTSVQNYIIQLLGGRREAQYLIPLFQEQTKLREEITKADQDAGKAVEYQAEQQRTLGYQLSRVREELNQIGDALAQLGVLGGLALLAAGVGQALSAFGDLLRFLSEVDDALQGFPTRIIVIATAVRTLAAALRLVAALRSSQIAGQIISIALGRASLARPAGAALLGQSAAAVAAQGLVNFGGAGIGAQAQPRPPLGTRVGTGAANVFGLKTIGGLVGGGAIAGAAVLGVAAAVGVAYAHVDAAAKKRAAEYKEQLSKLDFFELERGGVPEGAPGRAGVSGVVDDLFSAFGVGHGENDEFRDYLNARLEQLRPLVDAAVEADFLNRLGLSKKDIKRLKEGARDSKLLNRVGDAINGVDEDTRNELIAAARVRAEGFDVAQAKAEAAAADIEEAFATGKIDYDRYIAALQAQERLMRRADTGFGPDHDKAIAAEKKRREAEKARIDAFISATSAAAQVTGQDTLTTQVAVLEAALRESTIRDDPDKARQMLDELLSLYQQIQERAASELETSGEQLAKLREEIPIPEFFQDLYRDLNQKANRDAGAAKQRYFGGADARVRQTPAQDALAVLDVPTFTTGSESAIRAAEQAAKAKEDQIANARFDLLAARAQGNAVLLAQIEVDRAREGEARARLGNEADKLSAEATRVRADRGLRDAYRAVGSANIEMALAVAKVNDDVAEVARLTIQQAKDALDNAIADGADLGEIQRLSAALLTTTDEQNKAVATLMRDAFTANIEMALAVATVNNDVAEVGRLSMQQAEAALEAAIANGNPAEIIRARANIVTVKEQIRQQMLDMAHAFADSALALSSALASALGDAAEVGRLSVEQAVEEVRRARENGTPTDVNNALANLATVRAEEANRARQSRIGDLEYLYEFDRITAEQLIGGLTAELAKIPETNRDARREIERRIRALREEMGRDLQFNLPTELRLPTLYQARRLDQERALSTAGTRPGSNVTTNTDSRTYNLTLFADNAVDGDAAIQKFVDVITGAPRTGNRPRLY